MWDVMEACFPHKISAEQYWCKIIWGRVIKAVSRKTVDMVTHRKNILFC